jgi:hypothetical protein
MKIYNVEIPTDLEIPELDEKTKAEIDALHEEFLCDEKKRAQAREKSKDMEPHRIVTADEIWRLKNPDAKGPPPKPSINIAALRKLPPHTRAIFAYIHRNDITY